MTEQWSFRKTGTMGTLASQAEIGVWQTVWVQAPGCFCEVRRNFEIMYAKSRDLVHFRPEKVRNVVHNSFLNNLRNDPRDRETNELRQSELVTVVVLKFANSQSEQT